MKDMIYKLNVFHDDLNIYTWFESKICSPRHKLFAFINAFTTTKINNKKLDDHSCILNEYKITFFLALRFKTISKNETPFASL
jgi:hypothetical protein